MGKKGGGDAPTPDPQIGQAALLSAETGKDWLAFAKDAFKVSTDRQKSLDELTAKVTGQQLGIGELTLASAKEDRARYKAKGIPAQDAYAAELGQVGSVERQQQAAAEARAGVQTEASIAREQAQRENAAMGVRPDSGRAAAASRAGALGTATATAGAGNAARTNERAKRLAALGERANIYSGLPAQASAGLGLTLNAGSSAVGLNQNNQQLSNSNATIMNQGYAGMMQGTGQQANILLNQYGIQVDAWKAEQEAKAANAAGMWQGIGTIAGAAFGMSSPKAKKDIRKVGEGKGLEAVKKMPVSTYKYKPGVSDGGAKEHVSTMSTHYAKARGQPDTGVIDLQDAIGITMKAVQDLDAKVSKLGKSHGARRAA